MVEPSQPVDLLLNLQGLEVVKLRLMRLELCEVAVLEAAQRGRAPLVYRRLPLQGKPFRTLLHKKRVRFPASAAPEHAALLHLRSPSPQSCLGTHLQLGSQRASGPALSSLPE